MYEINKLKDADAEAKEIVKFEFGAKDFNPYDPHGISKNHCAKVYYPLIHNHIIRWRRTLEVLLQ